ncbi:MAG: NADH-quinone oxidoreductase subunit J [Planctomycetaceae bacterium]|nr:NADH-quinone oxidoreductase subunit J [Planctomycetaceae bacterium]
MAASEILLNVVFYVLAAAAVGGAVAVAASRNIVRSAFALLAVLFSVAALYAVMKADFIAAAQVLIYVGGILVLIIFAVMLTHRITDVKLSNDSTPGPAAFCACLCLLFSLVVVILFTAKWRRDSEVAPVKNKDYELALRQYQADGATGVALGGTAIEESVVVSSNFVLVPDASRRVEQVVFTVAPRKAKDADAKDKEPKEGPEDLDAEARGQDPIQSKFLPYGERGQTYRATFDKLPEGDYHWRVKLLGKEKDAKGADVDREWTFPAAKTDFSVRRGVTEPIALALAGPYLFAFEVVSVLLLAALVGAAFLARKEVKE